MSRADAQLNLGLTVASTTQVNQTVRQNAAVDHFGFLQEFSKEGNGMFLGTTSHLADHSNSLKA